MPYKIIEEFESRIAKFAGARYGIAVESCSAAIFLSCVYRKVQQVTIPKHTYPSVPCSVIHAGGWVRFSEAKWSGVYKLAPYDITDGALRFRRGMYEGGLHCVSFHNKKHLPIGRGGMILTDDVEADRWLRLARFDGRQPVPLCQDDFTMLGWNMYMTPEQAARGLQLFEAMKDKKLPDLKMAEQGYPDLSKYPIYQSANWKAIRDLC
jgi:dTDP-4-amino-4,6-dideoxygalactose transaminase